MSRFDELGIALAACRISPILLGFSGPTRRLRAMPGLTNIDRARINMADVPVCGVDEGRKKACSVCEQTLDASPENFALDKRRKDGVITLLAACRSCIRERGRRAYRGKSKEFHRAKAAEKRARNPGRDATYMRAYRAKNPAKVERERERARLAMRRLREADPERSRRIQRRHWARKHADPVMRVHDSVRKGIRKALRGNKVGRTFEIVDFTAAELIAHLERQFCRGMRWENYGEWHIDHIIPVAAFKFSSETDPEFRACWALTNLRPLWADENARKQARRELLL